MTRGRQKGPTPFKQAVLPKPIPATPLNAWEETVPKRYLLDEAQARCPSQENPGFLQTLFALVSEEGQFSSEEDYTPVTVERPLREERIIDGVLYVMVDDAAEECVIDDIRYVINIKSIAAITPTLPPYSRHTPFNQRYWIPATDQKKPAPGI